MFVLPGVVWYLIGQCQLSDVGLGLEGEGRSWCDCEGCAKGWGSAVGVLMGGLFVQ